MKTILALFLLCLLTVGCSDTRHREADSLERMLAVTPILTTSFDSLLQEVRTLPPPQRVAVLLSPTLRNIKNRKVTAQQELLLLETIALAPRQKKKKLLLRLLEIYKAQLNYDLIPRIREKILKLCEELENQYTLSQEERWIVIKAKATQLNKEGQQELCLPLWFRLLEEHRQADKTVLALEDLQVIATIFYTTGDSEKSISMLQEIYKLATEKGFIEQRNQALIAIINQTVKLGKNEEVLSYFHQMGVDSMVSILPAGYSILGQCYLQLGKADSARIYLKKEAQTLFSSATGTISYSRIAETFIAESNEDSTTFYLNKAMDYYKEDATRSRQKGVESSLPMRFLKVYPAYATLLQQNGKTRQAYEAFDLVEPLMKEPNTLSSDLKTQIDALGHYTAFCRATHQYEKGLALLQRRDSLRTLYDDILQKRAGQSLIERFKMQELLYAIDLQKAELSYSRQVLMALAGAAVILLCAIAVLTRQYRQRRRQLSAIISKDQEIEQLRQAASESVSTVSAPAPSEELFRAAEQRVTSEKLFLNKELSLELLARELSTNRSYLSACVNTCSGGNFNQWINNYRIAYVIERIDTDTNLLQLASEAGFLSPDSFYRNFKRCTQMTTSQYLKEKGKTPD